MTASAGFLARRAVVCCTFLGTLIAVKADVPVQIAAALKRGPAARAHVWPFTRVREPVIRQVVRMCEHLWAQVTRKRSLSCVGAAVPHHVAWLLRRVAAQVADEEPVMQPAPRDLLRTC